MNAFKELPRIKQQMVYQFIIDSNNIGVSIIPFIKGSAYKEPSIMLIKGYRPAVDGYTFAFPAGRFHSLFFIIGLVDKGETPEEAAIREMKEETGYSCELAEVTITMFY